MLRLGSPRRVKIEEPPTSYLLPITYYFKTRVWRNWQTRMVQVFTPFLTSSRYAEISRKDWHSQQKSGVRLARKIQVLVSSRSYRFKSCYPHLKLTDCVCQFFVIIADVFSENIPFHPLYDILRLVLLEKCRR